MSPQVKGRDRRKGVKGAQPSQPGGGGRCSDVRRGKRYDEGDSDL